MPPRWPHSQALGPVPCEKHPKGKRKAFNLGAINWCGACGALYYDGAWHAPKKGKKG